MENDMRKRDPALRQKLLSCAHRIKCCDGAEALNIRKLAAEAGVSVGTLYNYFESKQDVLLALTEEYWKNALLELQSHITNERFSAQIRQIYGFLCGKMNDCARIFMQSLPESAEEGYIRMASMQAAFRSVLLQRIDEDALIRSGTWRGGFTKEAFIEFVFSNVIALLRRGGEIDFLIQIVERVLYESEQEGRETKDGTGIGGDNF